MNQNSTLTPFGKTVLTGLAIYGIYELFRDKSFDTVVYYLFHKNRIVYIGIAYKDRIESRLDEHERKDWVWDEYDYGYSMSREQALGEEMMLIKKHRPK